MLPVIRQGLDGFLQRWLFRNISLCLSLGALGHWARPYYSPSRDVAVRLRVATK